MMMGRGVKLDDVQEKEAAVVVVGDEQAA